MLILILFKIGITNFILYNVAFAFVLFSFQGAKLRKLFRGEAASEVFFAYFLVHKKVSGGLERTRTSDLTLIRRAL